MPRFVLYLLTALELALVVWGAEFHPARLPNLPPPPTFTPVENNSLTVIIGMSATVREDQEVIINCGPLIDNVFSLTGRPPAVTWRKNNIILTNGSEISVVISEDGRFCVITATSLARGGELGTSGNYTCRVCGGDATADCINGTSRQIVCGIPHLVPPTAPPIVQPTFITLTCGQDVTVPTLVGVSSIIISCQTFNGSEPLTTTVYKDGIIVGNSVPHTILNPTDNEFGTYTVVVSTDHCGAAHAVSRILQQGDPPNINKTMIEKPTAVPENKRVNVGSLVNISVGYNLTIDCIVTGTPPIAITWIRNDNDLLKSTEGNTSNITITVTEAYDGDNITCRADNNIGFDNATTTINVVVCEINCKNGTRQGENCSCDCFPGFEGRECQTDIDECIPNPCENNATCSDLVNNYTCKCIPGYTGRNCAIDIDDCNPNPCQNEGTCADLVGGYNCVCTEDFNGTNCTNYIGKCPDNYKTVSVGFSQPSYRVNERDGSVRVTVVLSDPVGCSCYTSVTVTTGEITAESADYDTGPHPVKIPDGLTYDEINIAITNDDKYEDGETFYVTIDPLSLPYGVILGSNANAVVTIMDDDSATVKFKEVNCEIYESVGTVEHTLVLNKPLSASVTIEVITVGQSTQRECDYNPGPYYVTIPAGDVEIPFIASINDDDVFEANETFQLVIHHRTLPSRISRANPYSSTVKIMNDEEEIKVNFNHSTFEVNEHEGPAQPVLVLSKPSPCCLHVLVEVMGGNATGGVDYHAGIFNVTFPIGVTCTPFDIPLIDDTLSEGGHETFNMIILEESLPFGVILDDPVRASVKIIENDFYLNFNETEYMVYEDEEFLEVVLVLDKEAKTDFTIQVMDESNTATRGADYDFTGPHNVTFKKGDITASIFVAIINDSVYENGDGNEGEDFNLAIIASELPDGVYLGDNHTTTVTIVDDEYTFCFTSKTYLVEESVGTAVIPLRLSRALRKDVVANFSYVDYIATGNHTTTNESIIDYYAKYIYPNTVIIPAGDQDFLLTIKIVDDRRLENNELFRVTAGVPDIPDGEVLCSTDVIIRDDDDFKVTFENASYIIQKNKDITVKLRLIYPEKYNPLIMFPINVTVDELDITAIGGYADDVKGIDYVFQNYSFSFEDGEKIKSLIIRTIDDNIVEPDETYELVIDTITTGFSTKTPSSRVINGENPITTITIPNDDVSSLRIDKDKNQFQFSRPLSENITLNITYGDNSNEVVNTTGKIDYDAPQSIKEVQVLVPNIYNEDSIVVSADSKNLITIVRSK